MVDVIKAAAKDAGELIFERHKMSQIIDFKEKTSFRDIVTEVDTESQNRICEFIKNELAQKGIEDTEIGFVGEENLNVKGKHLFVIDPIDGTTNFVSGLPFFCVSVAYAFEGKLTAGVIIEPISGTVFWGETGKGAFVEKDGEIKQLKINNCELRDTVMTVHANSADAWQKVIAIYPLVRGVRNLGSVALELALLAQGTINAAYNSRCYIWDVAAAEIITREAGGILTDINGNKWVPDWNNTGKQLEIVAGHPERIKEICEKLRVGSLSISK